MSILPGTFHRLALLLALIGLPALCAAAPKRIVSLSPNLTESVFALGGGGQMVGVTDFCSWPPQVKSLKRCGAWSNPNFEVISALQPDLILVLGQHQKVREFARERHIAVAGVTMDSAETIISGLKDLGRLIGRENEATSLTARLAAGLAACKADLAQHRDRPCPTVFLSIGRQPGPLASMLTATKGSFIDEALTLAGGKNVFGDTSQYYPQVAKESLVVRRPDVILELTGGVEFSPAQQRALLSDWKALASIPAVRDGRIYILPQDFLSIPGPRMLEIIDVFRSVLFPGEQTKP